MFRKMWREGDFYEAPLLNLIDLFFRATVEENKLFLFPLKLTGSGRDLKKKYVNVN